MSSDLGKLVKSLSIAIELTHCEGHKLALQNCDSVTTCHDALRESIQKVHVYVFGKWFTLDNL